MPRVSLPVPQVLPYLAAAAALLLGCGEKRYFFVGLDRVDLVTDQAGAAPQADPNLVAPVGIQVAPSGNLWLANAGSGTVGIYAPDGTVLPAAAPRTIELALPASAAPGTVLHPMGIAYNDTSYLQIQASERRDSARYLFATTEGSILGFNADVDGTHAVVAVDNSAAGAVYTGLTISAVRGGALLYAANFGTGTIDVFDGEFQPAQGLDAAAFEDQELPAGYAPFSIQHINGYLYVAYALRDTDGKSPVFGAGNGLIDVFGIDGRYAGRLVTGGSLNAPWGLTSTPWSFPYYGRALLVGNHGDGTVDVYDLWDGAPFGKLNDETATPVAIDGLWDLAFTIDANGYYQLLFSAAPNGGQNGALGTLLTHLVRTNPPDKMSR